jgi:hypothetical protein
VALDGELNGPFHPFELVLNRVSLLAVMWPDIYSLVCRIGSPLSSFRDHFNYKSGRSLCFQGFQSVSIARKKVRVRQVPKKARAKGDLYHKEAQTSIFMSLDALAR